MKRPTDSLRIVHARAPATPRAAAQLLARAALYRLIAQGITYPDAAQIVQVQTGTRELLQTAPRGSLPRDIEPLLRELLRAWRTTTLAALRSEYSRLFLGTGLVPLRECGYGDAIRFAGQPVDIADLNGFYLAFGFEVSRSPPDHLGTEAEFVSLLNLKTLWALEQNRLREARITERAIGRFFEAHLGRWVAAFQLVLAEAKAIAPFTTLATLLRASVEADCLRLRIKSKAAGVGNVLDPVAEDALVCPLANGGFLGGS